MVSRSSVASKHFNPLSATYGRITAVRESFDVLG